MPKLKDRGIDFTLSKGFKVSNEWTIKKLKKALNQDYLDGLVFFIEF